MSLTQKLSKFHHDYVFAPLVITSIYSGIYIIGSGLLTSNDPFSSLAGKLGAATVLLAPISAIYGFKEESEREHSEEIKRKELSDI